MDNLSVFSPAPVTETKRKNAGDVSATGERLLEKIGEFQSGISPMPPMILSGGVSFWQRNDALASKQFQLAHRKRNVRIPWAGFLGTSRGGGSPMGRLGCEQRSVGGRYVVLPWNGF